jgi:hypothetical protein
VALLISTALAVIAYLVKNEVLDPLRAFKATRWKAATVLIIHENILVNIEALIAPGDVPQTVWDAKAEIRHMAAELNSAYAQIPRADWLAPLRLTVRPQAVRQAVAELIGLGNSPHGDENRQRIANVRQSLEIPRAVEIG